MKILLVLIVIVFIVAILLSIGIIKGMSGFSAPNKESDSIAAVKRFLDFDFGNEYEVIEHNSQNFHPDRPLKISVKLLDNAIDITNSYFIGLSLVTTESISDGNKYTQTWKRTGNLFQKTHTASHINSDETDTPFFVANLTIDVNDMLIVYNEYMI